jgi:hypothetical protein
MAYFESLKAGRRIEDSRLMSFEFNISALTYLW